MGDRKTRSLLRNSKYRDTATALVLAAIGAVIFSRFVPLDPDFHHDGLQFAPALALGEGLNLHEDVFAYYGPLTYWLQGWLLSQFGSQVLVLRLQTAASLIGAGLLLFALLRLYRVPRFASAVTSTLWMISCPSWSQRDGVFAFWPLPSSLLVVFVIASVILIRLSELAKVPMHSVRLLASSGVVIGLAVFVRAHYAIPLIVAVVIYLLLARRSTNAWMRRSVTWFISGVFGGASICVGALILQGALTAHIQQTLVEPFDYWTDAGRAYAYFLGIYFVGSLPFLALALILRKISRAASTTSLALVGVLILTGSALLALVGLGTRVRSPFLGIWGTVDVTDWPVTWANSQVIAPLYASVVVVVTMSAYLTIMAYRRKLSATDPRLLLCLTGFASLAQIYPLFDQYHLWWASPLTLASLTTLLLAGITARRANVVISILLIPFILASGYEWNRIANRERVPVDGPVLQGMLVYPYVAEQVRNLNRVLSDLPQGRTRFHCGDSLLAAWNGTYLPSSGAHVSWAFGGSDDADNGYVMSESDPKRFELPPSRVMNTADNVHIVCTGVKPGVEIDAWVDSNGLVLTDYMGPLQPRYDRGYFVYRLERRQA